MPSVRLHRWLDGLNVNGVTLPVEIAENLYVLSGIISGFVLVVQLELQVACPKHISAVGFYHSTHERTVFAVR